MVNHAHPELDCIELSSDDEEHDHTINEEPKLVPLPFWVEPVQIFFFLFQSSGL